MTTSNKHACWSLKLASTFVLVVSAIAPQAHAQVTSDGTLGTRVNGSTSLPCNSGTCTITDGTTAGTNLFHSFENFSVPTSGEAHFDNAGSIQNIISRVTGLSGSNIDGLIRANGKANLFLLNPNGIIFGPNAQLNLGGSFVATTSNAIEFGKTGSFGASTGSSVALLTVNPSAFLFNQIAAVQPITSQANLRVPRGASLLFVGGDVSLSGGQLLAQGGRVELGGLAGQGTIGLNVDANNLRLSFPNSVALSDISLLNGAVVDSSGEGGGTIQLQGRLITLTDQSRISANTSGSQNGGGISIQASQLLLQGGSQVSSDTSGTGRGGNINVNAAERVELIGTSPDNKPSKFSNDTRGAGEGGNLTITTRALTVRDGARISASTSARGSGGNISVNAAERVELIGTSPDEQRPTGLSVQTRGAGEGGNLTITSRALTIRSGAEVSASTFGAGQAGNIEVSASDSVELMGTSIDGQLPSRLFAQGGGREVLRNGVSPPATGNGGNLTVTTRALTVRDGAQVTVSNEGSGVAGNLALQAHSILVDKKAKLLAQTASGEGGNIQLQADSLLLLRRHSEISATAGGTGNGGNITINAPFLVAVPVEDSNITANALRGRGGNINITTSGIYGLKFRPRDTPNSDITASSEFGVNGTVQINTLGIDPSQGLANLPSVLVDASGLVGAGCAVAVRQDSNFVVTGRGGLPSSPNDTLRPANVLVDLGTRSNSIKAQQSTVPSPEAVVKVNPDLSLTGASFSNPSAPLVEATGWVKGSKGEVILIAHSSWLTSPNCEGR